MATKRCDVTAAQINDHRSLVINGTGAAMTRDVRVAWDDGTSRDVILGALRTIEETLMARGRADGVLAANS